MRGGKVLACVLAFSGVAAGIQESMKETMVVPTNHGTVEYVKGGFLGNQLTFRDNDGTILYVKKTDFFTRNEKEAQEHIANFKLSGKIPFNGTEKSGLAYYKCDNFNTMNTSVKEAYNFTFIYGEKKVEEERAVYNAVRSDALLERARSHCLSPS
jgi:hypothetical protein